MGTELQVEVYSWDYQGWSYNKAHVSIKSGGLPMKPTTSLNWNCLYDIAAKPYGLPMIRNCSLSHFITFIITYHHVSSRIITYHHVSSRISWCISSCFSLCTSWMYKVSGSGRISKPLLRIFNECRPLTGGRGINTPLLNIFNESRSTRGLE